MSTKQRFRSVLGPTIQQYLELKKGLGRVYANEGRILEHLDSFLFGRGTGRTDLNSDSFAGWCNTYLHLTPGVRRNWMRIARNLCLYRRRKEPRCFVPDKTQFPRNHQPVRPYILTEHDVASLLNATATLEPTFRSPLRREVFRLGLVLLYTAGLRRRELVRLKIGDYDPAERTLLIRVSKFYKSRVVALSSDASREIGAYLAIRRRRCYGTSAEAPLLVNWWAASPVGRAYSGPGFAMGLRELLRIAKLRTSEGRLPRVHDFRHSFAVHALVRWYRAGADVQAKLPLLAAYMGHVSIASTQHYLPFVESIAVAASKRFARHFAGLVVPKIGARS
jgi:integrase